MLRSQPRSPENLNFNHASSEKKCGAIARSTLQRRNQPRTTALGVRTNMNEAHRSPGCKRARLFSRDPLPGFVFGLDTNRKGLRLASSSSESCVLSTAAAANQSTAAMVAGVERGSAPSAGVGEPSSGVRDTYSVTIEEASVGAEQFLAGVPSVSTSSAQAGGLLPGVTATAIGANEVCGTQQARRLRHLFLKIETFVCRTCMSIGALFRCVPSINMSFVFPRECLICVLSWKYSVYPTFFVQTQTRHFSCHPCSAVAHTAHPRTDSLSPSCFFPSFRPGDSHTAGYQMRRQPRLWKHQHQLP